MTDEPVVNLYPDDPDKPTLWISEDAGSPIVVLRKSGSTWTAHFDRHQVAHAPTAEALTAHLLAEHGLVAVLADHGIEA